MGHIVQHKWSLLCERHIDQMILCAFFAVGRLMDTELPFYNITAAYNSHMPHAKEHVFRGVLIAPSNPDTGAPERRDTIIAFYNEIFVSELKETILLFAPSNDRAPVRTGSSSCSFCCCVDRFSSLAL